jgi:hypothetical protein
MHYTLLILLLTFGLGRGVLPFFFLPYSDVGGRCCDDDDDDDDDIGDINPSHDGRLIIRASTPMP